MTALIFERKIQLPGIFGVWNWSEKDWKTPIVFPISKGSTYLLLEKFSYGSDSALKREIIYSGKFGVHFDEPSQVMVKAARSQSDRSAKLAEEIFTLFDDTMRRTEYVLRTTAGLKELFWL